jgi:hypothetical protein
VRFNNGFRFPNFDGVPPQNGTSAQPVQTVKQYELGYKGLAARRCGCDISETDSRVWPSSSLEARSVRTDRLSGSTEPGRLSRARGRSVPRADCDWESRAHTRTRYSPTTTTESATTSPATSRQLGGPVGFALHICLVVETDHAAHDRTSIGRRFSDNANCMLPGYSKLDAGIWRDLPEPPGTSSATTTMIGLTEGDPRATQNVLGTLRWHVRFWAGLYRRPHKL